MPTDEDYEIVYNIAQTNNCFGIGCGDCPLYWIYKDDALAYSWDIARKWLELYKNVEHSQEQIKDFLKL